MSVQISRILHAGYVVQSAQARIVFDPIFENPFSRNCYAYPSVTFNLVDIKNLKLDAIFISHFHDDHCSLESLNYLDRSTPIYMYSVHEEIFSYFRQMGFSEVYTLKLNETVQVKNISVRVWPALDRDVDSLFHIQVDNLNILNVVDSWIDEDTLSGLSQIQWDLILWPFQTMRELEVLAPKFADSFSGLPAEWIAQLQLLKPKNLVASSCQFIHEPWSWYNQSLFPVTYNYFKQWLQNILPQCHFLRIEPGQSICLDAAEIYKAEDLPWISINSAQVVDYEYNPYLKIPSTAEISKNFPELNQDQKNAIVKFCTEAISKKYFEIGAPANPFFNRQRVWKLIIYDQLGQGTNYMYNLNDDQMVLIKENQVEISWSTEISEFKLYQALTAGESLTSMYLRVNDIFDRPIEVDVLCDPLVRCLYDNAAFSYQAAQLKKLGFS